MLERWKNKEELYYSILDRKTFEIIVELESFFSDVVFIFKFVGGKLISKQIYFFAKKAIVRLSNSSLSHYY